MEGLPETTEDAVAFRLVLDPGELTRGDYELSIDVVKEDQFWLAEKGATPRVIPVVIAFLLAQRQFIAGIAAGAVKE